MTAQSAMEDAAMAAMTHDLKIWPEYFEAICDGRKTWEVRTNDRDFREGDTLHLREYQPVVWSDKGICTTAAHYTGRTIDVTVKYAVSLPDGLHTGMSIAILADIEEGKRKDATIERLRDALDEAGLYIASGAVHSRVARTVPAGYEDVGDWGDNEGGDCIPRMEASIVERGKLWTRYLLEQHALCATRPKEEE